MFQPGHLAERKLPFRFAAYTRVGFSDTDAQGVVYYGRPASETPMPLMFTIRARAR